MITAKTHNPMNILIAVDGSEHCRAAVKLICSLPLVEGSSVFALAVLIPRNASDHAIMTAILEQTGNCFRERGIQVNTELLPGYPAEQIIEYASRQKPDLIVLGAKGLRATLGILLGGVAQQVVEYSCCPVMVVRAPYRELKRFLLVTDGSPYSQRALEYLITFSLPETIELHVAHVLFPAIPMQAITRAWPVGTEVIPPLPAETIEELKDLQKEEERQGRALLDRAVETLKTAGFNPLVVLLSGDAATEIIDYARMNQIDLIVCGSRGLSSLRGALVGSVSRKLVHYSGCSVLVVKD